MFSSLMNKLNPKSRYSLEIVNNLVNNYIIPNCQRPFDKDRIKLLNNNFKLNFNPVVPLYFCIYNNKRYIVDGNHRLECYKQSNLLDKKIPIIDIFVNKEDEIYYYFKLINDTMSLNDIWVDDNEDKKILVTNVYNYFITK
jgi:hypothetical protein